MGITQEETHTNPWRSGNPITQIAESSFPKGLLTLPCNTYPQLLAQPLNEPFPSSRSRRPLDTGLARGAFPYTKAIKALEQFRLRWAGLEHHTDEPFIVWLSHPKSHTKINPAHFFAKGFSPAHTLFLETSTPSRVLPPLFAQERGVAAVVLDGYPSSRIVLQLARRWLKQRVAGGGFEMTENEEAATDVCARMAHKGASDEVDRAISKPPPVMKREEIQSADSLFSSDLLGTPRLFVMARHPGMTFDDEKVAK